MNDDDQRLEEALRQIGPTEPRVELRGSILARAREVRRHVRRRWLRRLGLAAALVLIVVVGNALERAEVATCEKMLAAGAPSRAESETKDLAVALADLLDGNVPRGEMERSLRMRMGSRPTPSIPAAWRRAPQELTF